MKKTKLKPTLHGKLMFPSEYIVAEDLDGRDVTLTISKVQIEDRPTDQGPQPMPFLYFEEMDRKKSDKRLGINVTNARSIARLYGVEASKWVGCQITIYPTTCEAFGDTVTCVRIRKSKPKAKGSSKSEEALPSESASEPEPAPDLFGGDDANDGEMSEEEERAAFGDDADHG